MSSSVTRDPDLNAEQKKEPSHRSQKRTHIITYKTEERDGRMVQIIYAAKEHQIVSQKPRHTPK